MLIVSTWLWGNKFNIDDVAKLRAGVKRNLKQPHRFVLVTDDLYRKGLKDPKLFGDAAGSRLDIEVVPIIRDMHLTKIRGCFARLRMFDPEWQWASSFDDKFVCIDLDTVITGPLDPLFDRPEPFVIMQGGNSSNPCPYNGALMMLRPGAYPEVWSDFNLEKMGEIPFYEFPDDQGWLWHKVPNAAGWKCGRGSGVFVFHKPGWPGWSTKDGVSGDPLPDGARLVTFSGWRTPKRFENLVWVRNNWRV